MPLDHSIATATIWFSGLALLSINEQQQNRCEFSLLRCDSSHRPNLDIQEVYLDASGAPISSQLVPHSLSLEGLISIEANLSTAQGVSLYKPTAEFNRLADQGDEEDFRWIPNIEGQEFHNTDLQIKPAAEIDPILVVSDGSLYTLRKTDEKFARMSVGPNPSLVPLGKIGYKIGIDITCHNNGSIVISNGSETVSLPKILNVRYMITVENHCTVPDDSFVGTDFQLFYDVLEPPPHGKFDLRRMIDNGPNPIPSGVLAESNFVFDGAPEICTGVFKGFPTH